MASPAINAPVAALEEDTDYGSDFSSEGEAIVATLLSARLVEDDNPITNQVEHDESTSVLRLPRILGREERSPLFQAARAAEDVAYQISQSVKALKPYPDLSRHRDTSSSTTESDPLPQAIDPELDSVDARTPLERFRSPPKKSLSVTDLVSPAWCELQYYYTLKYHGRKRRTLAMKQGSEVHQKLEDQVHTTVKVDIETKEDAWGLRIWNVIQGLRILRSTGLTRELEVWGTVQGLVVNGVIDELTYVCPDVELEQLIEKAPGTQGPPHDQMTISDYFGLAGGLSIEKATRSKRKATSRKIYIGDVKTRSGGSLPNGTAFRPTRMQLMLYHRLLKDLIDNSVEFSKILERYKLDGQKTFSDAFIAQVGGLNDDIFHDAESQSPGFTEQLSSQDSMTTLLAHNNLNSLWSLMISEFQATVPDGQSLGRVLKAEYRSRDDGEVLGYKTIAMDEHELDVYLSHELEWWSGQREPEGVMIKEAFKCRICEFADGCEWRLQKVDEAKEKARMTRKRTAAV